MPALTEPRWIRWRQYVDAIKAEVNHPERGDPMTASRSRALVILGT
jgi:hypothetical protein